MSYTKTSSRLDGLAWPIDACIRYVQEKGLPAIDPETFKAVAEAHGAKVI